MQATGTERAASYLRVSTGGQVEKGYGLPEQQAKTAEHCEYRGFRLVEEVRDEGVSGRLEERPGLARLLALAQTKAVDVVVAVNIKRLGRENRIIQDVLRRVRSYGVRVEFVEHASGEKPAERLLENLLGSFSEFEWETIRLQTMAGRERKAEEKRTMPNGNAPFGFRCISKAEASVLPEYHGRDGEYLVVEEEAAIIRELFERAAGGETIGGLVRWVEGQTGGRLASRAAVNNSLRNPAYCGRPQFRKMTVQKVDGKEVRRRRPDEERIELRCPPIVSEELFHHVGERLTQNRELLRGRPTQPGKFPLRGCVVCGTCLTQQGAPRAMQTADSAKGGRYYNCRNGCGSCSRADTLEELAKEALRQAATGALVEVERERAAQALKEAGDPKAAARKAERELSEVAALEEKLLDSALTGSFPPALVAKKQAELQARRETADRDLREAKIAAIRLVDPDEAARRAERTAAELAEGLEEALAAPLRFGELARRHLRITLKKDERPVIEVGMPPTSG